MSLNPQDNNANPEDMIFKYTIRIITPLLYAVSCAPVFLGILLSVALLENNLWLSELTGLYYVGDLVAVVAMFMIGGLVFGLLAAGIFRVERLQEPNFLDHLRHCALLYAGLLFSVFVLFISYESQAGGLGYAYGVAIFVIGAYAASIDALMLLLKRRRSDRAVHGGVR
ncbi:MAG: hypothetical protein ACFB50_01195 [Rubrobacteraceae bacterium]